MSFSLALTPAQLDLVERTHAFARDVVRPAAAHHDQAQEFPWEILEQAAREGFYNPLFYRDLIGDPTGLSLPLFMEELFWGCAGIGLSIVMPALALSAIAQAATPAQLLRWAPECFGEPGALKLAALAISEPEGGSDVRNLRTTARRDGGDWVIDGHKIWIGNGGIADVHVVNATVDPELGHRGQALFIVPRDTPGLTLVRKLDKLGCRASHTAEIRFDGCRVPGDHLLGGDARLERRLGARAREGGERLGDARRVRADAPDGRGAGARHRPRRARVRVRLGGAARGVRRPDPREAGHLVPARRPGRGPRRGAAADLAGLVDGGAGHPLPPRRGLDVEAEGVGGRGPHHRAGDPGRRRLGLRQRPPGRRSGTATPSSTRSSRARARSSGS